MAFEKNRRGQSGETRAGQNAVEGKADEKK